MKDVRSLRSTLRASSALRGPARGRSRTPTWLGNRPGAGFSRPRSIGPGRAAPSSGATSGLLNSGASAVTVTATFHDQVTGQTLFATPFAVEARHQAASNNVLQSLFGRTLAQGSFGPIRFQSTGPVVVSSCVNNVNACGAGAVSGQWLPGVAATAATRAGAMGQLAVSGNPAAGYRTNVVFVNPGAEAATVNAAVRNGGGGLLSSGTIGPLAANGFRQVELDSPAVFPGVAGTTDTNLWLEFASDQPVLAFASVIHNVSGDPFAIVATPDVGSRRPGEGRDHRHPAGEGAARDGPDSGGDVPDGLSGGRARAEATRGRTPVTLGQDYYLGKYEVTQAQWKAVMGAIPGTGHGAGDTYPVYYVSWNDIAGPGGFLERVNATLGPANSGFRPRRSGSTRRGPARRRPSRSGTTRAVPCTNAAPASCSTGTCGAPAS